MDKYQLIYQINLLKSQLKKLDKSRDKLTDSLTKIEKEQLKIYESLTLYEIKLNLSNGK